MASLTLKTLKNMYYNIKLDIHLQMYACFRMLSYGVAKLDAILDNSKHSIPAAGHHSDSDSTLLTLPESTFSEPYN